MWMTYKRHAAKLLSATFLFFVFSGLSSVLNYVLYPILGRMVSVGEYGEIQFLISLFSQLAVGFVVLNILAVIISVKSTSSSEQATSLRVLNHVAIIVTLPVVILATIFLTLTHATIGITNPTAILCLGIAVLINIPYTTSIGKLQGNDQFLASGVVNVLGAAGKLLCCVILVTAGFGVPGAIAGIGLGTFAAYIISIFLDQNRTHAPRIQLRLSRVSAKKLLPIRNQAIIAIIVMTFLTVLSIFDTIIARLFLDHTQAGRYAAIATTTKTILAVAMPLMWLTLPFAVRKENQKINRYIALTTLIGLVFIVAVLFQGAFITKLLTGIDAGSQLSHATLAAIAMSACALAFLISATMICRNLLLQLSIFTFIGFVTGGVCYGLLFSQSPVTAALASQFSCSSVIVIGGILSMRKFSN